MIAAALAALVIGAFCGQLWFPPALSDWLEPLGMVLLAVLVFTVGLDIGWNKSIFQGLRSLGLRVLLVPLAVVTGTLFCGTLTGMAFGYPVNVAAGISSGMGWYSLSAVMLTEMVSPQVGTVSFLANVFREVMAVLLIPVCARYLGRYTAIAPSGSTSMDTTLPLIRRYAGETAAVVSILNGIILTALVPVLVTLFCGG